MAAEAPSAAAATTTGGGASHEWTVRVYYEDTDFAGVVYYANYLRFIERARTEWLRAAGVDQTALFNETGAVFVVRRCAIDYRRPARFDDLLTVVTAVTQSRRASLNLRQTVLCDGALIAEALVEIACIDRTGRPRRLPAAMGALLRPADGG